MDNDTTKLFNFDLYINSKNSNNNNSNDTK